MTPNLSTKLTMTEKIGYSLGDAAANFVWRAWILLPAFLTDTYGLAAAHVGVLILLMRLGDGVTDIIMGVIADRTNSTKGKFRPWVLWTGPVIAVLLALQFTTPDISYTGKLIYAYVIYFLLTLAYTANNVPYGALMSAITSDPVERSKLASFRFMGAFGGGILVMTSQLPLVELLGGGNDKLGYQLAMGLFGLLFLLFVAGTYFSSTERIEQPTLSSNSLSQEVKELLSALPVILIPVFGVSVGFLVSGQAAWNMEYRAMGIVFAIITVLFALRIRKSLLNKPEQLKTNAERDISDLMSNKPWLMLLGVGIAFSLTTVVRPSAAFYYLSYVLERRDLISLFFLLTVGAQLGGAIASNFLLNFMEKKRLMIMAFVMSGISYACLYPASNAGISVIFAIHIIGDFFAGILPVVFFCMLGDSVDYSEWKNGRRATGLIFSAGTFINKTGIGFAGALVMLVFAAYGYNPMTQEGIESSLSAMVHLMAIIPCLIAFVGAGLTALYPLSNKQVLDISEELAARKTSQG